MGFDSGEARDANGQWTAGGLVGSYVARLQAALGTDKFDAVMLELRADAKIDQPAALAIHNQFMGYTVANKTPKPALFGKIHIRHRKLMEFKSLPAYDKPKWA